VVAIKRDTANFLPDANFQIGHRALQRSTSPRLLIPLDTVVGIFGATMLRRHDAPSRSQYSTITMHR
jgi:hypothetical protein